jgi:hypothetical protein
MDPRSLVRTLGAGAGLLLALALAGPVAAADPASSAEPTSASPSVAPAAAPLARVLVPSAGFTVELPTDWLVLELGDDAAAAQAAFSDAHPALGSHIARFAAMGPMNVVALPETTPDDPFPPTFTAFKGANLGMGAEQLLRLTLQGLPQVGVTGEVTTELLSVGDVPGYILHYDWSLPGSAGAPATPVHIDQLTVVTDQSVWAASVTDDAPAPDAWSALLGSFRLVP